MRILIAPDKFKGSLSAGSAAAAIRGGMARVFPDAEFDLAPIADGGEGTAEIFCEALGGEKISAPAHDALGRPIEAAFIDFPKQRLALVEMSEASGLWRLKTEELDPLRASTFGTGELMARAIAGGAETLYLALGGSATNDAGLGMARALGWDFLDADGQSVEPVPENFLRIRQIRRPAQPWHGEVVALCDVQNPLLGPTGASHMFGPQKGATPEMLPRLEAALAHIADLCRDQLGSDFRDVPGAGATGGLAFGLMTFCGGRLEKGFAAVSRLLDLESRVAAADVVVTGEGRIDAQTEHGKGPAEVARLARAHSRPVVALAGMVEGQPANFDACVPIANGPLTLDESQRDAAQLLEDAAERVARLLKISL
jgi:glycerate kinase